MFGRIWNYGCGPIPVPRLKGESKAAHWNRQYQHLLDVGFYDGGEPEGAEVAEYLEGHSITNTFVRAAITGVGIAGFVFALAYLLRLIGH